MRKTAKAKKVVKQSRLELVTETSAQDHKHLSSADLQSRKSALNTSILSDDAEISRLSSQLADVKARKANTTAILAGVEAVLGSRG